MGATNRLLQALRAILTSPGISSPPPTPKPRVQDISEPLFPEREPWPELPSIVRGERKRYLCTRTYAHPRHYWIKDRTAYECLGRAAQDVHLPPYDDESA
jgi:hypothetical protein